MDNNNINPLRKKQSKDKDFILQFIRTQVENGTGKPLSQLKKENTEDKLFLLGLKFVTTTKKALCKALNIEIDNACRYKRDFEKLGLLVQSVDDHYCPFSRHKAHLLSTNPKEFERLQKSKDTQLKMFDNEK